MDIAVGGRNKGGEGGMPKQAGWRDQERLLCSLPGLAFSYSIAHSIELC